MRRDPRDERQSERLAGSFLASLILHALLIALLLSVATTSSEQSAPESIQGNEIVTVTTQRITRAAPAAVPRARPPVPYAPTVAPPRAQPRHAAQPHPRILHELAKNAPTAPPNPTPAPIASAAPNPLPTQEAIVASPMPFTPAVPTSVPTASAVAVTIKVPPTAVPPRAPTAAPTAAPTPRPAPSAAPTLAPQTPAPPQPTAAPTTFAPVISEVTPQPLRTPGAPAPKIAVQPKPSPSPGIPSPGPTTVPKPAVQQGKAEQPGPKPLASAGPKAGPSATKERAPGKPVEVPPTPAPAAPTVRPKPTGKPRPDINARLRSLIPTEPVTPTTGDYHANVSRLGGKLEPTPPPEVIAQTKFLYEEEGKRAGFEGRIKMYVTAVNHRGPVTTCTGWLLRYPLPGPQYGSLSIHEQQTGRVDPSSDFGYPQRDNSVHPIIETNVTYACNEHLLEPFNPASPQP
ncbi:MAG: hypothetical protein ACXVAK_06380 [Vulcanimicrobiaceae bacterium]